jgi:lipoprotein-releasing system ATP-binding protein
MSLRATIDTKRSLTASEALTAGGSIPTASSDLATSVEPFVLTVSDLRKSFSSPAAEKIDVLRGIDVSAHAGEMIAVTGASGAGKSTLLQLLGGLEQPDHGLIKLDNFILSGARDHQLARFRRRKIGFVFQFHHLLPDLTALENVALPLLIDRIASKEAKVRAEQMLESLGIVDKASHPAGHLSGGEQQRVAVARALIHEPKLVLADEPTGNLDAATAQELAASMMQYCRAKSALVIVATHNHDLAKLCDRILIIHEGKIRLV